MLLAALLFTASTSVPIAIERPFADLSFDDALAAAKRDGKVVMIDFFTTWCGPCKMLDRTTWKDAQVVEWLDKKCVALKIDAEKEVELATRFHVSAYPTILFVQANGTELDRLVGYRDGPAFLDAASKSLGGKDSLTQAREKVAGHENDPMARQAYARELVRKSQYEEALKEYLWCFDEGGKSQVYAGVRRSFLLMYIEQLAHHYPPALEALHNRRDAAEARLVAKPDSLDDAADACALNRVLDEEDRTLALYDRVRQGKPLPGRLRIAFGREILTPLVKARRYGEVFELFDNPEGFVKSQIEIFESRPKSGEGVSDAQRKAEEAAEPGIRAAIVEQTSVMYEALVGGGRLDVAARVADTLIGFANVGSTYATLIECAMRAGNVELARSLAERGLSKLPESEQGVVRAARDHIPAKK